MIICLTGAGDRTGTSDFLLANPSSASTLVNVTVDVTGPAFEKHQAPGITTVPPFTQSGTTDSLVTATVVPIALKRNPNSKSKSRSFPFPGYVPPAHTNRTLVLCFDGISFRKRCV